MQVDKTFLRNAHNAFVFFCLCAIFRIIIISTILFFPNVCREIRKNQRGEITKRHFENAANESTKGKSSRSTVEIINVTSRIENRASEFFLSLKSEIHFPV